jgi:hypothetical protein
MSFLLGVLPNNLSAANILKSNITLGLSFSPALNNRSSNEFAAFYGKLMGEVGPTLGL